MKPRKIKHKRKKVKLAVLNLEATGTVSLNIWWPKTDGLWSDLQDEPFFPPLYSLWRTVTILTTIKSTKSITKSGNLLKMRFFSFCRQETHSFYPRSFLIACWLSCIDTYCIRTYIIYNCQYTVLVSQALSPSKKSGGTRVRFFRQLQDLHTCPASSSLPMSIPCVESDCASRPVANIAQGNSTKSIPTTRSRDSAESALKTNVDQVLWSLVSLNTNTANCVTVGVMITWSIWFSIL